jgi:branched-chain amino acid transport system permease protein
MKVSTSQLKGGLIPLIVATILLALFPLIGVPQNWLLYLFLFFIYLALANMWNWLAGYCGLISLCQPAFIGIGGYTLAILAWIGLPFYQGLIAGAIVAALFAVLISIPVFRLSGIYFAIGTLIVPELLRIFFLNWRPVGGALYGKGAGYAVKGATLVSSMEIYWLALIICVGSVLLMRFILRSNLGWGLAAIHDNSSTAASSGINVFKLKFYSFVASAAVTGLAGAVFYISQGFIEPTSAFNVRWTMILMLATIIGGVRIEEGPAVGAVIVVILHFLLARYGGASLLIQGVILVIIMLVAPQGIMGSIRRVGTSRSYRTLLRLTTRR